MTPLQYEEEEQLLQVIQQCTYFHWNLKASCICPSHFRLKTKIYSKSGKYKEENITSVHDEMDYENITGFAACDYDCKWWVGCVSTEEERDSVKIMFLH
jgi:hypothetical protein